ncbi:ribonuclease HI family protein [bacterium]|nr:ribonuclease HI family protein [bacterium]MBU3955830.1 ribonuclease HI family protein [bacterium]
MKNREILKFLAEKQSFPQLYKKYKTLDKSVVKKLLMDAAENFARSGAHKAVTNEILSGGSPALKVSGIIECFVDGAAQPNPGQAGAGAVFYRDSTKIAEISEYLGEKTNNQAEYSALIIALDKALKIKEKFSSLLIYSDSLLMVNQTNGLWRVKDAGIAVLIAEVKKKIENIKSKKNAIVSLKHIAREQNKTADALSVLAIKSKN